MKTSEIARYYRNKLGLETHKKRHIQYTYRAKDGKVPFPPIAHHSHGSGEVNNRTLKNNSSRLGMSLQRFKKSVSCQIGKPCIYLCFTVKLLNDIHNDPVVYGSKRNLPSIMALIEDVEEMISAPRTKKWNSEELKAVKALEKELKDIIESNKILKKSAQRVYDLFNSNK